MTPTPTTRQNHPQGTGLTGRQDLLIGTLVFALVTCLQWQGGREVAFTVLLQSYNWLFDFDASRYLGGWCLPGVNVSEHLYFNHVVRHPLTVVLRPVCLALEPAFSDPRLALMALTAGMAGLMAALSYALAARCCAQLVDRLLITAWASLSAQPLMLGIIPEMYSPAMLGIGLSLLWLSGLPGSTTPARWQWVITGVVNLGMTVTNAVLSVLASAVAAWGQTGLKTWLRREVLMWALVVVCTLLSALLLAWIYTPEHLGVAKDTAKSLWWAANMARGEPAPFWKVAATYIVYDVVAPISSFYPLPPPESHPMLDFRAFSFAAAGWCAAVLWLAMLAAAVASSWHARALRKPLLVAGLWLLFNVALHTAWQYRASVFIYGAHSFPALLVLLALGHGVIVARGPAWAAMWRLAGGVLLALLLVNNLDRYREGIQFLIAQTAR